MALSAYFKMMGSLFSRSPKSGTISANPKSPQRLSPQLQLRHLFWLLAGLAIVVAPHTPRLPWWLNLIALILFAWRIYLGWGERMLPRKWLLTLFVLGGVFSIYFT